jgi:hypothetical protein
VSSGSLQSTQAHYRWTDNSGTAYQFHGSFPIAIDIPDKGSLKLHYRQGLLQSISDEHGQEVVLKYRQKSLAQVVLPDGNTLPYPRPPCDPEPAESDDNDEQHCDVESNAVPGFAAIATGPGVSTLDARPASCQSYFVEFYGTERGSQIETGLASLAPYAGMVATSHSYPIVDFIDGDELVVIRSRDLASSSFNDIDNPNALYERLMRDGRQIQDNFVVPLKSQGVIATTEQGQVTQIFYGENQHVTLQLLIRQDMASPAHWAQIDSARTALFAQYGIRLEVVIIP